MKARNTHRVLTIIALLSLMVPGSIAFAASGTDGGGGSLSAGGGAVASPGPYSKGPVIDYIPVDDGGFENGPPPASSWLEYATTTCEWITDPTGPWGIPAHSGTYAWWGGGYCGADPNTNLVLQNVYVDPSETTLTFYTNFYRPDSDDADPDDFIVLVNRSPVLRIPLSQASDTYPNWTLQSVDLSAYAGNSIELIFLAISRGQSTGNVLVDDIGFGDWTPPPPPPNDDFDGATEIGDLPYNDDLDTTLATVAPDDPLFPCGSDDTGSETVWYAFTPTSNFTLHADTFGSGYDTMLALWHGTRGNLVNDACNDDSGGLQSEINTDVQAGVTYYIEVADYGAPYVMGKDGQSAIITGGHLLLNVGVSVPPPVNDDFDSATVMEPAPLYQDQLDASSATVAPDDPIFPCGSDDTGSSTIWYTFTPDASGYLLVQTLGSDYDTMLALWTGTRGDLTNVACNDDFADLQSRIIAPVEQGVTYYVEVAEYGAYFMDRGGRLAPEAGQLVLTGYFR